MVGTPDLVVEILSKSTVKKDKLVKFNRYQKAGVKESWIVDPSNETVDIYLLKNSVFQHQSIFFRDDQVPVHLFENFTIELASIFQNAE
ncbi:Uma2 family endonuclease [Neobacillus sp. SM06]|uniref:Uma2 family endonuclease n=1 Tax=Neobacillus sp. SM06 TaxID=3422492 RepID=UPI003D27472A